jgi:hypothetical protein
LRRGLTGKYHLTPQKLHDEIKINLGLTKKMEADQTKSPEIIGAFFHLYQQISNPILHLPRQLCKAIFIHLHIHF